MSGQIKTPGAGAEGPAWREEKGIGKVRATAILLAGGSGTRFGAAGNKVYVEAKGRPLLQYSVDALEQAEGLSEWILVVKDGEQELAESLAKKKPWKVVTGGATRQESVYHGLTAASGDVVLIHDGARPMIRPEDVLHCLAAVEEVPGCTLAVRSKDTIKLGDEQDLVVQTTERARTWVIQTPQCFRRDVLLKAHDRYRDTPGITDDCMLLELSGQPVRLVEGSYTNIKVTTPEDLALAEAFLSAPPIGRC